MVVWLAAALSCRFPRLTRGWRRRRARARAERYRRPAPPLLPLIPPGPAPRPPHGARQPGHASLYPDTPAAPAPLPAARWLRIWGSVWCGDTAWRVLGCDTACSARCRRSEPPRGPEGGREQADTPVPSRPAAAPRPPPPPLCFRVAAVPGCARGGGAVAERQRRGPGPSLAGLGRSPAPPAGPRQPCGPGASEPGRETAPGGVKTGAGAADAGLRFPGAGLSWCVRRRARERFLTVKSFILSHSVMRGRTQFTF
ncbi:translation initiation factor IF-2-like [Motacilla alba alba]|uniref:translation initiation factor IF-2-like n=1 Tax=Motacilla alba alba TaxID=1094192 RepID=UPI0018D52EC9|nr:translation initiation factor IF-2-like [Motacilla alba alba]